MPRVAVANTLSNVSQYLQGHGYEVVTFQGDELQQDVDAIILSGENDNVMGMMDKRDIPIINAEGMSAEQVAQTLRQHLPIQ